MALPRRHTIICALLLLNAPAGAAERQSSIPDGSCIAHVKFDDSRYDALQVENTGQLLFGGTEGGHPFLGLNPERIDATALKARCAASIQTLRATRHLPAPAISAYVDILAASIEDYCALTLLEVQAVTTPAVLRGYARAETCSAYVDALEGKTDLVEMWRQELAIRAKKNADPEGFIARNRARETAPGFDGWVRNEVLTFGWHNCANRFTILNGDELREKRETAEKFFSQTFHVTITDCEED